MLAILLALAAVAAVDTDGGFGPRPPAWDGAADEARVAHSPVFRACDDAMQRLAHGSETRLAAPRYARSRRWGWIARAQLVAGAGAEQAVVRVTCWSRAGRRFQVAVRPEPLPPEGAEQPPGAHITVDIVSPPPPPPRAAPPR